LIQIILSGKFAVKIVFREDDGRWTPELT